MMWRGGLCHTGLRPAFMLPNITYVGTYSRGVAGFGLDLNQTDEQLLCVQEKMKVVLRTNDTCEIQSVLCSN